MDIINIQKSYGGENPKELSPLVLAYIGDAVFELFVRTMVLSLGNAPVNKMHKRSREIVKAKGQSDMYFKIEDKLTEEEQGVFRRGRNAKSHTMPKNADLMDYKHATGLEALFGYLYLQGNMERLTELFNSGTSKDEEN
ncbi:MAG TPA: ribonuclease III [Lachnospiraceae bacterium]|nr:ribonuclease III [Lachnospiraceae bacterium]